MRDTWNGLVFVFVDVTTTGELSKNGLVDDSAAIGLFASILNSALNIFNDGTLIFSIVPRFSEKCVTVTVSAVVVVAVAVLAFTPFIKFARLLGSGIKSNGNNVGDSNLMPDDGGDGNGNTFDRGDYKCD